MSFRWRRGDVETLLRHRLFTREIVSAQTDQSSMSTWRNRILRYPNCTQWRFWSDCANVQADSNLCSAHLSKCTFCNVAANIICYPTANALSQKIRNWSPLKTSQTAQTFWPFGSQRIRSKVWWVQITLLHIEGWAQDCSKSDACFSPNLISSPWRRYEDNNISFCKQWKFRCHCSYEQ